jgi:hypothetical protein
MFNDVLFVIRKKNLKMFHTLDFYNLTVLDMALSYISTDFVEGLPKSNGKNVILVVEACLRSLPTF